MYTIKNLTKLAVIINLLPVAFVSEAFSQTTPKLSDPQVAHTAVTANQIDIDAGELAKEKSKNPEVIKFAQTMINDHKAVIQQASDLAKRLGVTPIENDLSNKLLADAKKTKESLKVKNGQDFDKAYIDNEVAYHKAVIAAVEGILIPETENVELKGLLEKVLPALQAHLHHAEMIQQKFNTK
jgi:putative membrane protein